MNNRNWNIRLVFGAATLVVLLRGTIEFIVNGATIDTDLSARLSVIIQPPSVPEPSLLVLGLVASVACGSLYWGRRRRRIRGPRAAGAASRPEDGMDSLGRHRTDEAFESDELADDQRRGCLSHLGRHGGLLPVPFSIRLPMLLNGRSLSTWAVRTVRFRRFLPRGSSRPLRLRGGLRGRPSGLPTIRPERTCLENWTFFVFRQTFDLTGYDPNTADLKFQWAADDSGQGFADRGTWTPKYSLNGGSLVAGTWPGGDSYSFGPTADLSSGFVPGLNVIDFYVEGNGTTDGFALNPISFTATPSPNPPASPCSASLSPPASATSAGGDESPVRRGVERGRGVETGRGRNRDATRGRGTETQLVLPHAHKQATTLIRLQGKTSTESDKGAITIRKSREADEDHLPRWDPHLISGITASVICTPSPGSVSKPRRLRQGALHDTSIRCPPSRSRVAPADHSSDHRCAGRAARCETTG